MLVVLVAQLYVDSHYSMCLFVADLLVTSIKDHGGRLCSTASMYSQDPDRQAFANIYKEMWQQSPMNVNKWPKTCPFICRRGSSTNVKQSCATITLL